MADTDPLAGLTGEQADEAIDRLTKRVDAMKASAKAAEAHLKAMKAARKDLTEPVPLDQRAAGTAQANAEPAQITVEGGQP